MRRLHICVTRLHAAAPSIAAVPCVELKMTRRMMTNAIPLVILAVVSSSMALCYYGTSETNPGRSCAEILSVSPGCYGHSAYYWIKCGNMANPRHVYCDMERLQGGWIRLTAENFTAGTGCPCEWQNYTAANGLDYCTTDVGRPNASWSIDNICPYAEINGYLLADQKGECDGFYGQEKNLNGNYVDGVSITIGNSTQRQHLFTYAVGREEKAINEACECHGSPYIAYPWFIEWDYLCDSGFRADTVSTSAIGTRILWTGQGCTGCCHWAGAPWFYKELPQRVNERIEVRILTDDSHANEMVLVREFELYIR